MKKNKKNFTQPAGNTAHPTHAPQLNMRVSLSPKEVAELHLLLAQQPLPPLPVHIDVENNLDRESDTEAFNCFSMCMLQLTSDAGKGDGILNSHSVQAALLLYHRWMGMDEAAAAEVAAKKDLVMMDMQYQASFAHESILPLHVVFFCKRDSLRSQPSRYCPARPQRAKRARTPTRSTPCSSASCRRGSTACAPRSAKSRCARFRPSRTSGTSTSATLSSRTTAIHRFVLGGVLLRISLRISVLTTKKKIPQGVMYSQRTGLSKCHVHETIGRQYEDLVNEATADPDSSEAKKIDAVEVRNPIMEKAELYSKHAMPKLFVLCFTRIKNDCLYGYKDAAPETGYVEALHILESSVEKFHSEHPGIPRLELDMQALRRRCRA